MDDPYSHFLQRTRLPQPAFQKLAVISIFQTLRTAPPHLNPHSDRGREAISYCLNSSSSPVVDQSVRELCRLVADGTIDPTSALLELQSALGGCSDPCFVDVFVKGIGWVVRFGFNKMGLFRRFDGVESHPLVKVIAACGDEVEVEVLEQVMLFVVENRKAVGCYEVCEFLRPFLSYVCLRVPFADSDSSLSAALFARSLVSSIASLCCSFQSEAMPFLKLLLQCSKYLPCKNAKDFKGIVFCAEYLVDAYTVVLKEVVATGKSTGETQAFGVQMLESLLSYCTNLNKHDSRKEPILKLSKRLMLVQRDLGLLYLPELSSVLTSLFVILTCAEFEYEQLLVLRLLKFLFLWKSETERIVGRSPFDIHGGLLLIFPVISLLSSPSNSVKALSIDLLSLLEDLLLKLLGAQKKNLSIQEESISKLESIFHRLLQHLWLQDHPPVSCSYFLSFAFNSNNENMEKENILSSWLSQLREYCLIIDERQKSRLISYSKDNYLTDASLSLSSVVALMVMHHSLGSYAIDALAAMGNINPKVGLPLLLTILFYNKIFCNKEGFHDILLKLFEVLPSLASNPAMVPLVVQTILPMLNNGAKQLLRATATRLLCKTWEVTDHVFKNLQVILLPKAFNEFDKSTCISMAASVRDICKKNPDRGVDLILSVSACIESREPAVHTLGLLSLGHLCEADVVDFYSAWDVITKDVTDYSTDPVVAHGICSLLKWGALDAEAYSENSKIVLRILWDVGNSRHSHNTYTWIKARTSAFESLNQYEVEQIQKSIPDFKERSIDLLLTEDNPLVLRVMEEFIVKIINFEHINRRRGVKEKRVVVNKVEKLLDVFSNVTFSSEKLSSITREFPGAALLCLSFTPKEVHRQGKSKELLKLHSAYENAMVEIAESLQLSRNVFVALLSVQSWKPFLQRWLKASIVVLDQTVPFAVSDNASKAANNILETMVRIAEESIPRCGENIAIAVGALCMVLPSSAHGVIATAAEFLLNWLFQFEHEHKQWSGALALGLVLRYLHATDHKHKHQIITGLLMVACSSKSSLVKGASGIALGFACQGLITCVEGDDVPDFETNRRIREVNFVNKIIRALCMILCQLSPSSFDSLESLCKCFPTDTDDTFADVTSSFHIAGESNWEEDVWGVAGLILGLGYSVKAMYLSGGQNAVITLKALLSSWITQVNAVTQNSAVCDAKLEILFSVGSCLALPMVVAFCLRAELIYDDELNHLINVYRQLISELLTVKKSGIYHQNLLMASCIGAGNLLSCILDEGVNSMKTEDIKSFLELFRKGCTNSYPPVVHFSVMLGVVNALGAGAGILENINPRLSYLQSNSSQKDSSYIRGPIISTPVCEPPITSLMQEMFLVAQNPKDPQLQHYAAWAVLFLKHRWWSEEHLKSRCPSDQADSTFITQNFPEDSVVWQLCLWLMNLNSAEVDTSLNVNTIAAVLRCLTRAPRLPSLEWGAIIRRCMRYEHQLHGRTPDQVPRKEIVREECIKFAILHADHVNSLILFLDELYELARFQALELNLQRCLLSHLGSLIKGFSGSRLEKLFDDMTDYFSSPDSLYQVYSHDQKSSVRLSFWKGICHCLDEASVGSSEYVEKIEKCMELLFSLLPALPFNSCLRVDQASVREEWSWVVKCIRKARENWRMSFLEVPMIAYEQGESWIETVKRIQARARLVMIDCIPFSELLKLKSNLLNAKSNGIWDALVDVVAALQHAEDSIKRKWFADAVEMSCISKYPSTAMRFIGLLSGSCCRYMPLLILDQNSVLSDLPVTVPSLLSDARWAPIAETVVLNLWQSTERFNKWFTSQRTGDEVPISNSIDISETKLASFLITVMHQTCVALKDYLPLEKQLKLASMVLP